MQVVGDLVEDVRGDQSALLVHNPDLNMPRSLRETFDFRWLISVVWEESPSQPMSNATCFVCMCRDGCGDPKTRVVCEARLPSSLRAYQSRILQDTGHSVKRRLWEETVAPGALPRPRFAKGGKLNVEVDRGGRGAHT